MKITQLFAIMIMTLLSSQANKLAGYKLKGLQAEKDSKFMYLAG